MLDRSHKPHLGAMGYPHWLLDCLTDVSDANAPTLSKADAWAALQSNAQACMQCVLHETRSNVVFSDGNIDARLCLVGEAPGAQEDIQGKPFVGRAGQLLNQMLAAMGLTREEVMIINILKCRPPNNRDPKPDEIETCTPFLTQQLALIQPSVIFTLGRFAAQYITGSNEPMAKLRGRAHRYAGLDIPVVAGYHPAYLLRAPQEKAKAWEDCLTVMQLLSQQATA